jgi:hypothetical protein
MKTLMLAAAATLALAGAAGPAEARPGGCIKYGLGGAVIGHFAGGHRLAGAAAGCAIGAYRRSRAERRAGYDRQYDRGYRGGYDRPRGYAPRGGYAGY